MSSLEMNESARPNDARAPSDPSANHNATTLRLHLPRFMVESSGGDIAEVDVPPEQDTYNIRITMVLKQYNYI